jgi:alpha-tubulin suppressor-like RCC1 family protein
MTKINNTNLHLKLSEKVTNICASNTNLSLLEATKTIQEMKIQKSINVLNTTDLPTPNESYFGILYFVEFERQFYVVEEEFGYYFWRKLAGNNATLWTWGTNYRGRIANPTGAMSRSSPGTTTGVGTNWCQVSAGPDFTMALKTDGSLWAWGSAGSIMGTVSIATYSPVKDATIFNKSSSWCQVSSGVEIVSAICSDGTLWTWGNGQCGGLGSGTTTTRPFPGTTAGGGSNWCQTSAGFAFESAIKTDGTLWTWGFNYRGRLGDGTTTNRCSPGTTAGGGTNWCQVNSGIYKNLALKTDGTLWTWGNNNSGGLGDGTTTNRCSPGTTAGGGTNWCQIGETTYSTFGIKTDGTLWSWGNNVSGQLGDGTKTNRCSPGTTAGGGTNWCFVGTHKTRKAGELPYMTTAIKTDGTLWTWGQNFGALGDGTTTNRCSPGTTAGGGTSWCQVSSGSSGPRQFTAAISKIIL